MDKFTHSKHSSTIYYVNIQQWVLPEVRYIQRWWLWDSAAMNYRRFFVFWSPRTQHVMMDDDTMFRVQSHRKRVQLFENIRGNFTIHAHDRQRQLALRRSGINDTILFKIKYKNTRRRKDTPSLYDWTMRTWFRCIFYFSRNSWQFGSRNLIRNRNIIWQKRRPPTTSY